MRNIVSAVLVGVLLILLTTLVAFPESPVETELSRLPTPTPTPIPPLSAEYECTNPEDLNRFSPGDTVRVIREAYLVENPSQSRLVVTGVAQVDDILIVHGNDNGVHCSNINGRILYYGVRLNLSDPSKPKAFGFFHPEEVEE